MNTETNSKLPSRSVEFSHIYTDEKFSKSQIDSINCLKRLSASWDFPYSTVILFDNYNIKEPALPQSAFFHSLDKHNALPDFWAFEKDLVVYTEDLLSLINKTKIKKQYENYINNKKVYPCSFLTSIWYFLRLGYIKDTRSVVKLKNGKKFSPNNELINILPEDFKEVENKSLKLIKATVFQEAEQRIENLFYSNGHSSAHNNKLLL